MHLLEVDLHRLIKLLGLLLEVYHLAKMLCHHLVIAVFFVLTVVCLNTQSLIFIDVFGLFFVLEYLFFFSVDYEKGLFYKALVL